MFTPKSFIHPPNIKGKNAVRACSAPSCGAATVRHRRAKLFYRPAAVLQGPLCGADCMRKNPSEKNACGVKNAIPQLHEKRKNNKLVLIMNRQKGLNVSKFFLLLTQ